MAEARTCFQCLSPLRSSRWSSNGMFNARVRYLETSTQQQPDFGFQFPVFACQCMWYVPGLPGTLLINPGFDHRTCCSPAQHGTAPSSNCTLRFWKPRMFFSTWYYMANFFFSIWGKLLIAWCGTLLPLFWGLIPLSGCNHVVIVQQLIVPCCQLLW